MEINSGNDPPIQSARTTRRKENKNNSNEFIIKSSLVNSLYDKSIKNILLQNVAKRVENTSKGLQRLSFAISLLLKDLINKCKNPLKVSLPPFLSNSDTTFARHLMIGIETAKTDVNENILKFLCNRGSLLPDTPKRFIGDKNTITSACEKYLTNYKTYIETTFEKKQKAFLNVWCNKHGNGDDVYTIRSLINGWKSIDDYEMDSDVLNLITFQRKLLHLEKDEAVNKVWIKNNYEKVIVYYEVLSKYLTKHGHKGILTAPICNMKSTFIHIDTDVFYYILKDDLQLIDGKKVKLEDITEFHWSKIFNTDKFLTNKEKEIFQFTGTVQTDGVSICIHYRRPKIESGSKDPYVYEYNETDRLIGQDPGRVNLFYGVEKMEDGSWKRYILPKKQYYEEAKINYCNKKSTKWNQGFLKQELEKLSKFSTKSTVENFIGYITVIKQNYDKFWNEYLKKRWARQRLKLYSNKKSVYDKFYNSMKDNSGRRVVIAYGDAGFASSKKHEISAPTTRVCTEAKKHFKVVMVDEYLTTQIHHETGKRLGKVIKAEGNSKIALRGLLWYCSTKGSKFVSRDFNAAKNIRNCARLYPHRPNCLDRETEKQPKATSKYINKEPILNRGCDTIYMDFLKSYKSQP